MMRGIPSREMIEYYRRQYPPGTRIELDCMPDDPNPVPAGSTGTVRAVDDIGQLVVKWDNKRSLSLIPGVDSFHVIPQETEQEETQEMKL